MRMDQYKAYANIDRLLAYPDVSWKNKHDALHRARRVWQQAGVAVRVAKPGLWRVLCGCRERVGRDAQTLSGHARYGMGGADANSVDQRGRTLMPTVSSGANREVNEHAWGF